MKKVNKIILILIAAAMLTGMVSCGTYRSGNSIELLTAPPVPTDDPDAYQYGTKHIYENRFTHSIFYYSAGYPDDWTYAGDEHEALEQLNATGRTEGYLCAKFYPKISGRNGNVAVTVYKYSTGSKMNTLNGITKKLMDAGSEYYFNDMFHEANLSRKSLFFTDGDYYSEKYNHFQWNSVNYSFVKGEEAWKGTFHITTANNTWFFLVCVEAMEDLWDENLEVFNNFMNDFTLDGLTS